MSNVAAASLGATPHDGGTSFGLYSSVAEHIDLCLFDDENREIRRLPLVHQGSGTWNAFVPGVGAGQRYGFRVSGPSDPAQGSWCNPAKLLVDPYARELAGDVRWHTALAPTSSTDSAPYVPKSVVREHVSDDRRRGPARPWSECVFYETNVRGYTMLHEAVPELERGTFRGFSNAMVLDYIRALGITVIELLPVHAWVDERHLATRGLRNFWGYNPISFFAPMPRLAAGDPVTEFREMVDAIHDAGLEVVLDVVYNHTAEGGAGGPTLCYRGLDNAAYYRLNSENRSNYINDTGTGNTVNADSPVVQRLVLDSLRYWHRTMGVDGFRFDLATILGRRADGFDPGHPLLEAIASEPQLRDARLVAEPWDPGPGGYQLGKFPGRWCELNDQFRDAARRFWRGDERMSGELARRLHGSADIFQASGRAPHASVNKITSHDGFTLADVVTYERRHNYANGENNRDGHAHNFSRNYGVEGPTENPDILEIRRRQRLNLLATLICAQGTPFLLAGDEFGHTQRGNNNAYAQDNAIGWLDWSAAATDPGFTDCVRTLLAIRREYPHLTLDRYVHGTGLAGGVEYGVSWINPDGGHRTDEDWDFGHAFGLVLQHKAEETSAIVVLFNAWSGSLTFELGPLMTAARWEQLFASHPESRIEGQTLAKVCSHSVTIARGALPVRNDM
jgi:isoamylase